MRSAGEPPASDAGASELAERLRRLDAAFDGARRDPSRVVPCGRGCSSCCAAVFDVDAADAERLGHWLDRADAPTREDVLRRGRRVVAAVRQAAERLAAAGESELRGWRPEDGFRGVSSRAITRLAGAVPEERCPLLDAFGACRAHAARPVACRLQGLPWRDEEGGHELPDWCRLEPAMAENEPVTFELDALHASRAEARIEARRRHADRVPLGRTFVADALMRWTGEVEDAPRSGARATDARGGNPAAG